MSIKRIIQLVAGYSNGDAISNEARTLRTIFQSWGYESLIVCEAKRILPELLNDACTLERYMPQAQPDDLLLLHLSIGSCINTIFARLPGRKALLYHNITPPNYLRPIHAGMTNSLAEGREQMQQLAGTAEINLADSQFNADELHACGFSDVHVLPLVLNWESLNQSFDETTAQRWNDGKINILFVGRCVPNKRIEDLLFAFHFFNTYVQPRARLIIAGSYAGTEKYFYWLLSLIRKFSMNNVEPVGTLTQPELNATFRAADLFLCMSEHEGFCIPLLEAMEHNIPVLAYDAGAVAETMNGAGVLFSEKKFDQIAEMMGQLTAPSPLRTAIINAQQQRIQRYKSTDLAAQLKHCLAPFLGKDEVRQQPE